MKHRRVVFATWLLAVGGMATGHWLSYVVAAPDAHDRAELLAETGHGVWGPLALGTAMALFAAAATTLFLRAIRTRCSVRGRLYNHAPRLIALQCGLFVAVEALERVMSQAHGAAVLAGGVIVLGLAVQALSACAILLIGGLLTGLVEIARRAASPLHLPLLRPQFTIELRTPFARRTGRFWIIRLRGPPGDFYI